MENQIGVGLFPLYAFDVFSTHNRRFERVKVKVDGRARRWVPAESVGNLEEFVSAGWPDRERVRVYGSRRGTQREASVVLDWERPEAAEPDRRAAPPVPAAAPIAPAPGIVKAEPSDPGVDPSLRFALSEDLLRMSHFERMKALAESDVERATLRMRQEHERSLAEREHQRAVELESEQRRHERLVTEMAQRHEMRLAEERERAERDEKQRREHAEQVAAARDAELSAKLEALNAELDAARAEIDEVAKEADESRQHAEEQAKALALTAERNPEDLQSWIIQQFQTNPDLVKKLISVVTEKLSGETGLPLGDNVGG